MVLGPGETSYRSLEDSMGMLLPDLNMKMMTALAKQIETPF